MPDDSIEFRSARPGRSLADWLAMRLRRDSMIYGGAALLLLFCALFALVATYIFAFLVMMGFNTALCGVWRPLLHLPALAVVIGLFFLQRKWDGDGLEPIRIDAGSRGNLTLRLTRLTGSSWLMHLDNPSSDLHPVVRLAMNLALLTPRLFRVSVRMALLSQRMRRMDYATVAAALNALMQAESRVAIGDLLQDFPQQNPQRLIGDLTAIDGVVLLTSNPPGLTLTPAVAEEFKHWKKAHRERHRPEGYAE